MPSEWSNLQTLNGSQADAFEQLVCQLAEYEPVPPNSDFTKKGSPDAGVECFWKHPDGTEEAWQAKFFTISPLQNQWGQVDESVKTALKKHPDLKKYTVCMALDRSDSREEEKKSCLDRWCDRVKKWKRWAEEKNMEVEFLFWGTHEIFERLAHDDHRGRHFFWFNDELLTPTWFKKQVNEKIASVGDRFTPGLNIKLPISSVFSGLSRSSGFFKEFEQAYDNVGKAKSKRSSNSLKDVVPDQAKKIYGMIDRILEFSTTQNSPGVRQIDFAEIKKQVSAAIDHIQDTYDMIEKLEEEHASEKDSKNKASHAIVDDQKFSNASRELWGMEDELKEYFEFLESDNARVSNLPALLLTGPAGIGKTHIFSDAALNHIKDKAPAILLLGNQFHNDDPWSQILRMLGLQCTKEDFLGALESAAKLSGKRAIIFIDALNEGEGRMIWKSQLRSILKTLSDYPWVSIAISVRSTYTKVVLPENLGPEHIVRSIHTGFSNQAYQAQKTFFDHYEIELPTVPILTPEFENPLFLSCFCRGLKNRQLTKIPTSINGITSVFDFFINSVNDKLAKPDFLDYDPKSQCVTQATKGLAAWISDNGMYIIPREIASSICNKILPGRSYQNSLFHHLLSESVISETVTYDDDNNPQEKVIFLYERLADHLVMGELLAKHANPQKPLEAFAGGKPLNKLFNTGMACWENRGLLEALAIQGPEILKKEIYELLPYVKDADSVCEAFMESLIWRNPNTITTKCLPYINEWIAPDVNLNRMFFETLLTVAPIPNHCFNADFLHEHLFKLKLADRDAWWSTYLHHEFGSKGAVDRLVDWAWSNGDKTGIADDSIRLTGKALIWLLTTSNRFLRDHATKALVSIFENRIGILCQVIPDFVDVNDLYVSERLYAAAYGCAMRSTDQKAKEDLAELVYECVFKDGMPPVHILLRDYARGVIEVGLNTKFNLNSAKLEEIRPPYKSAWPLEIPTEEDIEKLHAKHKGDSKKHQAIDTIHNSIIGYGDFSRYILGYKIRWSKQVLGAPRIPSLKEQYDNFESSLTSRQNKSWESYLKARGASLFGNILGFAEEENPVNLESSDEIQQAEIERTEQNFRKSLGIKKGRLFTDTILPYMDSSHFNSEENSLPVNHAQRWIFKRVIDLGWTGTLFGEFDNHSSGGRFSGRSANKMERIGKKYQWIAYHEYLAHLSDNHEMQEDSWSGDREVYEGPWQLSLRDIDPSLLIKKTQDNQKAGRQAWWTLPAFDSWTDESDDIGWLKSTVSLPPISPLPIVKDPETGKEWLNLECFYTWKQPSPVGKDEYDIPLRHIYYMLRSYLVKAEDETIFYEWAKDKHFMEDWMPKSYDQSDVLLGECFWSPAYAHFNNPLDYREGWTWGGSQPLPCDVLVASDGYMQENGGYDCSLDESVFIHQPAKFLVDKMELTWNGNEGQFYNSANELVAQDPSVAIPGPRALLMDKEYFLDFLNTNGYRIVWTLLCEKTIRGGMLDHDNWPGRLEMSATMKIAKEQIEGLATAYWVTTGPKHEEIAKFKIPES